MGGFKFFFLFVKSSCRLSNPLKIFFELNKSKALGKRTSSLKKAEKLNYKLVFLKLKKLLLKVHTVFNFTVILLRHQRVPSAHSQISH